MLARSARELQRGVFQLALKTRARRVDSLPRLDEIRSVLVPTLMGIGNLVMFLPFLRALRNGCPNAHVAAVASDGWPGIELLTSHGIVDEVIESSPVGRAALLRSGLRLARRHWDICIVRFNSARYDVIVGCVLGGIPVRVGHVSSGRYQSSVDWLFNFPVSMRDREHEVDRYLAIAEALGLPIVDRTPRIIIPAPIGAWADKWAAEQFEDRRSVAIQPGTSDVQRWKRWPIENWRNLVERLNRAGILVIGLGSSAERVLVEEVLAGADAINLAGRVSLLQSAAVLERAAALVATDSAMVHVAAAVGLPVVGIYGPTDSSRTRPFGLRHTVVTPVHCRRGEVPCLDTNGRLAAWCTAESCMARISVEGVADAVAAVLSFGS